MEEWNFHHNMPITENRNREINWPACLVECVLSAHKIKKKAATKNSGEGGQTKLDGDRDHHSSPARRKP